jgi:serine/threonine-protein kinase
MAVVFLAETVDDRGQPAAGRAHVHEAPRRRRGGGRLRHLRHRGRREGLLRLPEPGHLFEVGKHCEDLLLRHGVLPRGDLEALLGALHWQERRFPASLALQIGIQVLEALSYVLQAQGVRGTSLGLVHGDINTRQHLHQPRREPAQARRLRGGLQHRARGGLPEGMAAGKLHYLSPEQAAGRPLSPQSDLFSVGVVMFELLLGRKPFDGPDADAVLAKIASGRFELPGGVSGAMAAIFEKALARHPKNRYPTAGAFAGDLLRYQLDSGLQALPGGLRELCEEALQILT